MYTDTHSPNIYFGFEQTLIFKYNVVLIKSTRKAKIKIATEFHMPISRSPKFRRPFSFQKQ